MSPLKRKKLNKIRLDLDKLDNSLIKIIKKRTNLVKKVLKLKEKKSQIVDQNRIRFILKNIRKKSLNNNIDPKLLKKFGKI
jgi:chorismate mutase